jgi:DNA-binding NtrC family response regulator
MAHILIFDDNKNVLAYWQHELAAAGHEVSIASDSHEAFIAMGRGHPDLVIMDSDAWKGSQFIAWILEQESTATVIYSANRDCASQVGRGGVIGFVDKTDEPETLTALVARVLRERQHQAPSSRGERIVDGGRRDWQPHGEDGARGPRRFQGQSSAVRVEDL